jgi:hypothetical protein
MRVELDDYGFQMVGSNDIFPVIASEAKQSRATRELPGLLRRPSGSSQ